MKAIVKSPLHHDGKAHEIGSEVDLTEAQAKSLAAIGVVEIFSTIVDKAVDRILVGDEKVSSGSAQEDQGKAQEEAPKVAKKTSKRRTDDE